MMKKRPSWVVLFSLLPLALPLLPAEALGYGYTREEDPLLKAAKVAIFYGKKGQWDRVAEAVNSLDWQV
ncbi:MAG: hypothetical protein ACE5JO_12425, partial [Candidatus Binatia bacterium]